VKPILKKALKKKEEVEEVEVEAEVEVDEKPVQRSPPSREEKKAQKEKRSK